MVPIVHYLMTIYHDCYYQLRQLRTVARSLTAKAAATTLVHASLHYCTATARLLFDPLHVCWLRSSNSSDVFVPGTKTKMGNRAFEVAGPHTWNSLPATIRATKILPAFKSKQLKLYLIGNPEQ